MCIYLVFLTADWASRRLTYFEEHDGVLAGVVHEEVLEVVGAGSQHHLVTF